MEKMLAYNSQDAAKFEFSCLELKITLLFWFLKTLKFLTPKHYLSDSKTERDIAKCLLGVFNFRQKSNGNKST